MARYRVKFSWETEIEAEDEDEAIEEAIERLEEELAENDMDTIMRFEVEVIE